MKAGLIIVLGLSALLPVLVFPAAPQAEAERWDVGLTSGGAVIEATVVPGASASSSAVLLLGGLHGNDESVRIVDQEIQTFTATRQDRRPFRLLAISRANPEGTSLAFPPAGVAYRENAESHVLWRWIAIQAPDLVVIAGNDDFGLAEALSANAGAWVGRIPARRVAATRGIIESLRQSIPRSEARLEIERRQSRSPRQVAGELAQVYGKDFEQPSYIPGMSLIGQLRLGRVSEVEALARPYVDGSKNSLARPASTNLAGHLVFAELAARTGDARYLELVRQVADLGFTANGEMKESMPLHDEMSDSVFMAAPILARAGKLTGDRKYFDMAARHVSFMRKLDLRPDGLYRHSPLSEAAWGRGNAFPALGLALTLSDLPEQHPEFARLRSAFEQHMAALARFQDGVGMWRQVIDHPGAYPEFSATAMIAVAYLRGIRNGWLPSGDYQPRVDRAWRAILSRIGSDGRLMNVCESTGKQRSLNDYLRRAAIFDRDPRGGGMALVFATEMAGLQD